MPHSRIYNIVGKEKKKKFKLKYEKSMEHSQIQRQVIFAIHKSYQWRYQITEMGFFKKKTNKKQRNIGIKYYS